MDKFQELREICRERNRSMVNLRNAVYFEKGLPYHFGSKNVQRSSIRIKKKITETTCLSLDEILTWLDQERLGLK